MHYDDLIAVLGEMPERDLIEVVNRALSRRSAEVARPEFEEAKLLLAEAYRGSKEAEWELLILSSPVEPGAHCTDGIGPTQEGSCCGLTLAAYAKNIVCPVCGKTANAT
jgi:hypothetical protein